MNRKTLFISNRGWFMGGGEHSFLDLVPNLSSEFDPVVLMPDTGDLYQRVASFGLPTIVLPLPALRPGNMVPCVSSMLQLIGIMRREAICLVYANGSRPALYGGIAGRMLGIPVVWHCRIADKDRRLDWLLKNLCSHIIVNSRATAMRFSGIQQSSLSVIYNGIDIEQLSKEKEHDRPQIPEGWRVILHCARISKWKRHDLSIDAFELIASEIPAYHLVFLGAEDINDSEWSRVINRKIKNSMFSDRIHRFGHLPDVTAWMKRSEMLILPSDSESFGRVIIEAMACGCVPIGVRSGGVPEIISDRVSGLIADPGSVVSLANAIRYLVSHPEQRSLMRENGLLRARDFSLEAHIHKMTHVLSAFIK